MSNKPLPAIVKQIMFGTVAVTMILGLLIIGGVIPKPMIVGYFLIGVGFFDLLIVFIMMRKAGNA